MRTSRLGCLTPSGIIAALLTAFVIAGVAFAQGGMLYSPGPLNAQGDETLGGVTSHADTGGDCKACHSAPWDVMTMADRCTLCHVDVAVDMRMAASLHGSIVHKNPNLKCGHCHPDHRGPDAPLTIATGADFPHEELGFSLSGHQQRVTGEAFTCSDCHTQSLSTFNPLDCQTCHQQIDAVFIQAHAINYGKECLACHDGVDRFGKTFSHEAFPFRLNGKHAQVDCVSCHVNARTVTDFASTPQDCFSCHQQDDAHLGRFGADCGACHSPEAWKPAKFDHNLAAFKLEGEHAEVACEDCHQNGVYEGTPTDCYSCHVNDDEHGGRFGTDCGSCHTPTDWENATFDHNTSIFPLGGAHVNVACEKCHTTQFAGTPTTCVGCHADPVFHLGLFGTECASCHTTIAWRPATFTARHVFPLDHGEGGTVSCATCHPDNLTTYICYGCHEHNLINVQAEHLDEGIRDFQDCVACHPTGHEDEGGGD